MSSRRPNFAIVGAQKAGSSLLHHALRRHPDVWLRPGEDHFFRDPVFADAGLADFETAYAGRAERRVGMKCPDYLACPEVPERLLTHLAEPDLIITLRHPIDRLLSAYYWFMRWGVLPIRPAEEGVRTALRHAVEGTDELQAQMLEWGLYGRHVTRYLDHFPRGRLHIVVDHDLRRDPAAAVRDVYTFLGVRSDVAAPTSSTKDNPGIYSPQRLRFQQLRTKHILNWENSTYHTLPKPKNPMLRAYSNGIAAVDRYLLARIFDNTKPSLPADLTAELTDYYREDIDLLESVAGVDLEPWRARSGTGRDRAAPPPV